MKMLTARHILLVFSLCLSKQVLPGILELAENVRNFTPEREDLMFHFLQPVTLMFY